MTATMIFAPGTAVKADGQDATVLRVGIIHEEDERGFPVAAIPFLKVVTANGTQTEFRGTQTMRVQPL